MIVVPMRRHDQADAVLGSLTDMIEIGQAGIPSVALDA